MNKFGTKNFPSLIRMFRETKQLTKLQLAHELNITEEMVNKIEMGIIEIPEHLFAYWAGALGFEPETFMWIYLQFKARSISIKAGIPAMFEIKMLQSEQEMEHYINKISGLLGDKKPQEYPEFHRPTISIRSHHVRFNNTSGRAIADT